MLSAILRKAPKERQYLIWRRNFELRTFCTQRSTYI